MSLVLFRRLFDLRFFPHDVLADVSAFPMSMGTMWLLLGRDEDEDVADNQ